MSLETTKKSQRFPTLGKKVMVWPDSVVSWQGFLQISALWARDRRSSVFRGDAESHCECPWQREAIAYHMKNSNFLPWILNESWLFQSINYLARHVPSCRKICRSNRPQSWFEQGRSRRRLIDRSRPSLLSIVPGVSTESCYVEMKTCPERKRKVLKAKKGLLEADLVCNLASFASFLRSGERGSLVAWNWRGMCLLAV